ncbi:hypothetical protein T492DRAFT_261017 [Pavlovales sp. CCMP2436]|nr:hypothetical protein T492DRAFT_261017 [Pavlovales sp. CCMP2436]
MASVPGCSFRLPRSFNCSFRSSLPETGGLEGFLRAIAISRALRALSPGFSRALFRKDQFKRKFVDTNKPPYLRGCFRRCSPVCSRELVCRLPVFSRALRPSFSEIAPSTMSARARPCPSIPTHALPCSLHVPPPVPPMPFLVPLMFRRPCRPCPSVFPSCPPPVFPSCPPPVPAHALPCSLHARPCSLRVPPTEPHPCPSMPPSCPAARALPGIQCVRNRNATTMPTVSSTRASPQHPLCPPCPLCPQSKRYDNAC